MRDSEVTNPRLLASTVSLILLLVVLPGQELQAQGGKVVGRVVDARTAQPLSGVQVYLEGGSAGTLTNVDGRYLLRGVPSGTHDIVAEMIGYGKKTVSGVRVVTGKTAAVDISLQPEAVAVEALEVSVERERGSSAYLLDRRRRNAALTDAIGAEEISRSPDSDAADVAARMTGVTLVDGKFAQIRGLGERYSQTTLNGAPLPSPEPEKESVPLDLFPSGFLESLETQKSYTPDLPADFSGGNVKISTKDFQEDFTVKLGIGTSVNTESQFRSGFLGYPGGDLDFLGVDDGSRELPSTVARMLGGLRGDRVPNDPGVREQLGRAFPRNFTPSSGDTPLNRSFDLSVGGRTELLGKETGFFVAGTYSDRYTLRNDEVERKFRTDAFDPEIPPRRRIPNVDYAFDRGIRKIHWGILGNSSIDLSPSDKLSLQFNINTNTDDEARRYQGSNQEDIGGLVRSDRLRFVSRQLFWGQLAGDHRTIRGSRLEWRMSLARADRDEPGLREALYLNNSPDPGEPFFLEPRGQSGRYFWSDLTDDDMNGQLDWRFPFELGGNAGAMKFGAARRARDRDFASRRFNWEFFGGTITNIDSALVDGAIVGRLESTGQFVIDDVVEPGDRYRASDDRTAGYGMLELPILSSLEAVAGARVERYELELTARDSTLNAVDQTDVLPSLNLQWTPTPDFKVRAAASRTLDRPEFREIAPFQFTEAASLRQLVGNPDLKVAEIRSLDLRGEWYPGPGELVSAGVYYKELEDPVEQVFITAASTAYSFQNAEEGEVKGVEVDGRLRLGRLHGMLENFLVQGNVTLVDSEVRVAPTSIFDPTNLVRPLQGQSEYVVNASLAYAEPFGDFEAGLFYNVFGERVAAAGGAGVPDIYEQPRHQLDATVKFAVAPGAKVKLKGSNLLDEPHRWEQSKNGITQLQRRYSVGRTFSVSLTWEIY